MNQPPIFLLVMDSLRADRAPPHMDDEMPQLGEFAKDSFVFSHAYATGSWTVPSHASIFTGKYPSIHGTTSRSKDFEPDRLPLAQQITDSGYKSSLISANPWISPEFGYDKGFDEVCEVNQQLPYPDVDISESGFSATNSVPRNILETLLWMSKGPSVKKMINILYHHHSRTSAHPEADVLNREIIRRAKKDTQPFIFANYMEAHEPYFSGRKGPEMGWNLESISSPPEPSKSDEIIGRYDDCVRKLDTKIGQLFTNLRENGLFNESLIIIVGDHGQALGENGYWGHGTFLLESLIHVPVLIRPPGGTEKRSIDEPWSLRKIYDVITTAAENTSLDIDEIINDTIESTVVAESAGPHMDAQVSEGDISPQGYRAYRNTDFKVMENLTTNEINANISMDSFSEVKRDLRRSHTISDRFEESDITVSQDTEARLEDLGYL